MAREKHIIDLKIENFKCFAGFEVKDLGQFNLIVGDNNTGKTSLLEALFFDGEQDIFYMFDRLGNTLEFRTKNAIKNTKENIHHNFFTFLNKKQKNKHLAVSFDMLNEKYKISFGFFDIDSDFKYLNELEKERLLLVEKNLYEFTLNINGKITTSLQSRKEIKPFSYAPFIPFGLGYSKDVLEFYSEKIDANKQVRINFIKNLKCLIPNVDDVRIGNDVINIYEENVETPMPLFAYGEGTNKLFRILCEIAMSSGKRLMIDEIDAGVHFSRFKQFWRTIMQVATAYDVQIFATTHNQECIDYFRMVLEEEGMKDYRELARVVSLKALEDSNIKARVYNFEDLEYANEVNRELRGGGL